MNRLPIETRVKILEMLCDGISMRSVSCLVGVSINTVTKLLLDTGTACAKYHEKHVCNVQVRRVQSDVIWSFGRRKKNALSDVKLEGNEDVWTWIGMDADSQLMISYLVENRSAESAIKFIKDLRSRLSTHIQLTMNNHRLCFEAAQSTSHQDVDYAQIVEIYGSLPEEHEGCGLTKYVGKKFDTHFGMLAIYFMFHNFVRLHKVQKMSPAMIAGIEDQLWEMKDLAQLVEGK